jgi:hypothetical protein
VLGHAGSAPLVGTLKTKLVHHQQYATRSEARSAIFEYMEVFSQSAVATFAARLR